MDSLSLRGAFNCILVGLFFGMGFHIAARVLALLAKLLGG